MITPVLWPVEEIFTDPAKIMAWRACWVHDNHNNDPLIQRSIRKAFYRLTLLERETYYQLLAIKKDIKKCLEVHSEYPK